MGWVTLTLRKKELIADHAYYQFRDLQISREKRQMARRKSLETLQIKNSYTPQLNAAKEKYDQARAAILSGAPDEYKALQEAQQNLDNLPANATTAQIGQAEQAVYDAQDAFDAKVATNTSSTNSSSNTLAQSTALSQAQFDYQNEYNTIKTQQEDELAMHEQEAADEEEMLDEEQADVEAQMEAISAELESVKEAISTEIKNSTIHLA